MSQRRVARRLPFMQHHANSDIRRAPAGGVIEIPLGSLSHAFPWPKNGRMNSPFSTITNQARSIERWVVERVAFHLDCTVHEVDPSVPLAETGMDSASAVGLCGDVEDHWQIEADPTLVFDYPTIADIAAFIAGRLAPLEQAA
jgi:acyl carrier protein